MAQLARCIKPAVVVLHVRMVDCLLGDAQDGLRHSMESQRRRHHCKRPLHPRRTSPHLATHTSLASSSASRAVQVTVTSSVDEGTWLAVGFSHSGGMVDPQPTRAVIGSSAGVLKHTLQGMSKAGVTADARQDLTGTRFTQENGVSTMAFTATLAYMETYATRSSGTVSAWLIWAHGSSTVPTVDYHLGNRGRFQLQASTSTNTTAPDPAKLSSSSSEDTGSCSAALTYSIGQCYVSYTSLTAVEYGDTASLYQHVQDLSTEFRVAWSIYRGADGHIAVALQARTTGWVGLGLMGNAVRHGMVDTDMWWGKVEEGRVTVHDAWALAVAPPTADASSGHSDDLYDVSGSEESGVTTLEFKRKLTTTDAWDYDIAEGPTSVVFAFNRQNADELTVYHGPSRGFATVSFVPALVRIERSFLPNLSPEPITLSRSTSCLCASRVPPPTSSSASPLRVRTAPAARCKCPTCSRASRYARAPARCPPPTNLNPNPDPDH